MARLVGWSVAAGSFFLFRVRLPEKRVYDNVLDPKPVASRGSSVPGGEAPAANDSIADKCYARSLRRDLPDASVEKIADLRERRSRRIFPALKFGVAGYAIVRDGTRSSDELRPYRVQQFAA